MVSRAIGKILDSCPIAFDTILCVNPNSFSRVMENPLCRGVTF